MNVGVILLVLGYTFFIGGMGTSAGLFIFARHSIHDLRIPISLGLCGTLLLVTGALMM